MVVLGENVRQKTAASRWRESLDSATSIRT